MTSTRRRTGWSFLAGPRRALSTVAEVSTALGAWAHDYIYALQRQAAGLVLRPDPQAYRLPASDKPAVVLLPGIYETWAFMRPVAEILHQDGYDVHAVVELGYNGGTVEDMAQVVERYIRLAGIQRCVMVAHSKGGLIGKTLLSRQNKDARLHGLVAINTPFQGSPLARLLPLPALRVFLPRSPELTELAASRQVNSQIVSIYGLFDPHIPGGSRLEGAHNVQLDTRGHFLPLSHRLVHQAVLDGVRRLSR